MAEWKVPGYTELRALGSGGFGEVMLARHQATGVLVAIKYLRQEFLADQEFARMFRSEAEVLASLDDPFIVRLYEYVESPSGAAIVMELIDGVSLREILVRQGSTTAEAALVVLRGSLMGLAAAHRHGVVHRDYKPENVLIDGEGVSKLTDFGLAARTGEAAIPAGTLRYVAPEQIAGAVASPASDVYSATATFYECLTGAPPFRGESEEELLRQHSSDPVPLDPLPEPLRPLVTAGMAKDPALRPVDAMAFVAELRTVASGAYGEDWVDRGRSHLGEAALLLAALWPAGAAPAVQGTAVEHITLSHHLPRSHSPSGAHPPGPHPPGPQPPGLQPPGPQPPGLQPPGPPPPGVQPPGPPPPGVQPPGPPPPGVQPPGLQLPGLQLPGPPPDPQPPWSRRLFQHLSPVRIGILLGVIAIIVAGCVNLAGYRSFVPAGNPTTVHSVFLQPTSTPTLTPTSALTPTSTPSPTPTIAPAPTIAPTPTPDPGLTPPIVGGSVGPSPGPDPPPTVCCVG
jgi:eukaryotic-like serine/threonine-protein kinase